MATIAKVPRKDGHAWKAIIKQKGKVLTTKTFSTKTNAKTWARRIESDQELMRALGSPGAHTTFDQLCDEYMDHWNGKDQSQPARVGWWLQRLGSRKLIDIEPSMIRAEPDEYATGKARRYDGVGKDLKPKRRPPPGRGNPQPSTV